MTLSKIVAAVAVLLGCVAFASFGRDAPARATAEGPGWRAVRADGAALTVAGDGSGVRLPPGARLEVDVADGLGTIELDAALLAPDATVGLQLDGDDHAVAVDAATASAVLVRYDGDRPRPLDTRAVTLDDARRVAIAVTLDGDRVRATLGGATVFEWTRVARGASLALTASRSATRVERVSTSSPDGGARVVELTPQAPAFRVGVRVRRAGGALLAVAWLFALARVAGLSSGAALGVSLFALAPLGAAWAWAGVMRRPPAELVTLGAVVVGLPLGAWIGRRPGDAASTATVSRWCGIVALALTLGATADVRSAWLASRADAERAADARAVTDPVTRPSPTRLDASGALVFEGPYRDATITFTVSLADDSALLVRTRADDVELPVGTSLLLSTSERRRGGWLVETPADLIPRGEPLALLAPDREHTVELRLRGRTSTASLDGRPVAELVSDTHVAGGVVFVTAPGVATVRDLRITRTTDARDDAPRASALASVAVVAGFGLLLAGAWALLRRGTDAATSITEPLGLAGLALLPVAVVLVTGARPPRADLVAQAAALTTAALLLAALWARARALPLVVAALVVAAAAPTALRIALEPRPRTEGLSLNDLRYTSWRGERLHDDLLYLEHPLHRRFDFYLARHTFRGRAFELPKPAGTRRVAVLGGSSTWGYRLDAEAAWPARLDVLLGADTEVMNVGVQAGTGPRLARLLRDVVLGFEPDAVVVSLTFNDSFAHSRGDEQGYLRRVTAPTFERSWWRDALDRHEEQRGRAAMRDLSAAFARGGPDVTTLDVWQRSGHEPPSPPARFERTLQDFVDLCAAHDVELVFVQEPVRDDARRFWKDEFHAVMADVGARHGLPVVDPWAALRAAGADGTPMFMDGVHPTAAGCRAMAAAVAPAVRAALERR